MPQIGLGSSVKYLADGGDLLATYASLPSTGGAIVLQMPGSYDVGAGLVLTKDKNLSLVSFPPWNRRPHEATADGAAKIYSTSNPTALISLADGAGVNNQYGGHFENLLFQFGHDDTKYGIYGQNWNGGRVVNCIGNVDDAVTAVDQVLVSVKENDTYGNDASWWHLIDCWVRKMALFESGTSNTYNQDNGHKVVRGIGIGWGDTEVGAKPFVRLNGNHRSGAWGCSIEGYEVGFLLDKSWQCVVRDNCGDAIGVAVFVKLQNTACSNTIDNPGINAPAAGDKLVEGDASSVNNCITAPSLTNTQSLYTLAAIDVDPDNWILAPSNTAGRTIIQMPGVFSRGVQTLDNTGTPSVLGGHTFKTGGTTAITDFDDGVVDQEIVILAEHAITITDGAPIVLNASGNYVMASGDTLTLKMFNDQIWHETGRSDNS